MLLTWILGVRWVSNSSACVLPHLFSETSITAPNFEVITGHWRLTHGHTAGGWYLLRKDEDGEYSSRDLGLMISCVSFHWDMI